jgi:hypothetical protein
MKIKNQIGANKYGQQIRVGKMRVVYNEGPREFIDYWGR